MLKQWPKVDEVLENNHFRSLEAAQKTIAALPPDDEDRRLFMYSAEAGDENEHWLYVRAATSERAELVAALIYGADSTSAGSDREYLWEIPGDLPAEHLDLLERCRKNADGTGLVDGGEAVAFLLSVLVGIGATPHAGNFDGWELSSVDKVREHFREEDRQRPWQPWDLVKPLSTSDVLLLLAQIRRRLGVLEGEKVPTPDIIASASA